MNKSEVEKQAMYKAAKAKAKSGNPHYTNDGKTMKPKKGKNIRQLLQNRKKMLEDI